MFQRKVSLAGLVTLVAVAACQVPTTKDTGKNDDGGGGTISARRSPTPKPSAGSGNPTPTPTATPIRTNVVPTPDPTPTPVKTPVPPGVIDYKQIVGNPNPNGKTTLTGAVYNNAGTKFEKDAKVIYKIENGAEAQVTIEGGKYVLPDLAPGRYSITATEYGSTPRTQHVSLIKGVDYTLNFGEPGTDTQVYALYDKPEITKVEPSQFAADLNTQGITFKLSLSEPATVETIKNLVHNLRLAPMNDVAAGGSPPPVLAPKAVAEDTASDVKDAAFPWLMKYLGPDAKPFEFFKVPTATATELDQFITVAFPFPFFNGKTAPEYQLFLAADPAKKIFDLDGKILGTDKTGGLETHPAEAGMIVNNVFLSPYLGPDTFKKDTPETQWDSTHTNAIPFKFLPDTTPPAVAGLTVTVDNTPPPPTGVDEKPDGVYVVVEFNEPIAVVGPGGTAVRQPVLNLANYSFMVGINTTYLGGTTLMDGIVNPAQELPYTTENFGTGGEEFKLKADPAIKLEVVGPKTVRLYHPNPKFFDKEKAKAFSLRVAGIEDPAGNVLPVTQADKREAQLNVAIIQ